MPYERIIKFPFPEWISEKFTQNQNLHKIPYCVCYQRIEGHEGYGPYGFTTEKSHKIITNVLGDLFYVDDKSQSIKRAMNVNIDGIYLYGKKNHEIIKEYSEYFSLKTKNKIKSKKNLPINPLPSEPVLHRGIKDGVFDSNKINILVDYDCSFFISKFNMPEGGQVLSFFDLIIWDNIKLESAKEDVEAIELNTSNQLKAW